MSMDMKLSVEGKEEMSRLLRLLGERAPKAMGKALFKAGTEIMSAAKAITPVDTSTLKNSGTVSLPEEHGDEVTVTLGFGGAASDYAIHVHEDLEATHKPPTQAKYLETPLMEAASGGTFVTSVVQTLRQEFGSKL